jgi:hypothetical protein
MRNRKTTTINIYIEKVDPFPWWFLKCLLDSLIPFLKSSSDQCIHSWATLLHGWWNCGRRPPEGKRPSEVKQMSHWSIKLRRSCCRHTRGFYQQGVNRAIANTSRGPSSATELETGSLSKEGHWIMTSFLGDVGGSSVQRNSVPSSIAQISWWSEWDRSKQHRNRNVLLEPLQAQRSHG